MTRIYVTETDTDSDQYDTYEAATDPRQPRRRAGFFTLESATYWHGAKDVYDGTNRADVNTRDRNRGQGLYRTAQGRWVLGEWSNWQGETDRYSYLSDADARDWLMLNCEEEAVLAHFGEHEAERGPGRPEIGAAVQVRLGDLLPRVDAWATERGVTRADAVRSLVTAGLAD